MLKTAGIAVASLCGGAGSGELSIPLRRLLPYSAACFLRSSSLAWPSPLFGGVRLRCRPPASGLFGFPALPVCAVFRGLAPRGSCWRCLSQAELKRRQSRRCLDRGWPLPLLCPGTVLGQPLLLLVRKGQAKSGDQLFHVHWLRSVWHVLNPGGGSTALVSSSLAFSTAVSASWIFSVVSWSSWSCRRRDSFASSMLSRSLIFLLTKTRRREAGLGKVLVRLQGLFSSRWLWCAGGFNHSCSHVFWQLILPLHQEAK